MIDEPKSASEPMESQNSIQNSADGQEAANVVPMVSRASRLGDALARARSREETRKRELMDAREGRLAALAQDLEAMADELPADYDGSFELMVGHSGDRLIIDTLSYVDLVPGALDYRLVRQRREGPQTVVTHTARDDMAEAVADYIAARIVEREGVDPQSDAVVPAQNAQRPILPAAPSLPAPIIKKGLGFWGGFWLFVLGGVCAATALFTYAWLVQAPVS